jgi:hypothetical protein
MGLSMRARDVLEILPSGSLVELDTAAELSIEITGRLTSEALEAIYAMTACNCTVDFESSLLSLTRRRVRFSSVNTFKSGLDPRTESEREAAAFADSLKVIDVDELIPTWHIVSTDCTYLHISRLLCISHDAFLEQVGDRGYHYDMAKKEVVVYFPLVLKRKRSP